MPFHEPHLSDGLATTTTIKHPHYRVTWKMRRYKSELMCSFFENQLKG